MRMRILHLGAGIQSSAIHTLMADGEIPAADYALFADTQDEPDWVYRQLDWLKQNGGPPIVLVTAGRLGDDLQNGRNSTGQRFASVPFHTTYQEGVKGGMKRRQCTREYKIEPIEKWIRYECLGLDKGQRLPKHVIIESLIGFSTDEPTRAVKMQMQYAKRSHQWVCSFPLFDEDLLMSKHDCRQYIEERSGFEWRSSRCVFCPYQRNHHFREIKQHDPAGFARAIEVDRAVRAEGSIANTDMREIMYAHRSCVPLSEAKLDGDQSTLFADEGECEQGCFL